MTGSSATPLAALDPAVVRAGLDAGLPESPHAFIRSLDAAYDRRIHIDGLVESLEPSDDLRIVEALQTPDERWVLARRLAWDSDFFGYGIARVDAVIDPTGRPDPRADVGPDVAALRAAMDLARRRGITYVTCTVGATDIRLLRTLHGAGFELIETRSHYHLELDGPPAERHPTRLAVPADIPSLAAAARDSVNPFDRFHSDPAIAAADADRLMERWVEASIMTPFADATIVPDVDAPDAFCTAKYHREHWDGWGVRLAQPVLSAVGPNHRGWYVKIISELNEHLRGVGADHSWLITQITNNAVIRSWEKLGYRFGKGEHVFRALL